MSRSSRRRGGLGKAELTKRSSGYSRVFLDNTSLSSYPLSRLDVEAAPARFLLAPAAIYPHRERVPRERNFLLFQALSQTLAARRGADRSATATGKVLPTRVIPHASRGAEFGSVCTKVKKGDGKKRGEMRGGGERGTSANAGC